MPFNRMVFIDIIIPLSCAVVDCGVPPNPGSNGHVTYTDTTFRAIATYSCKSECYQLVPNIGTITCLSNGSWSRLNVQCHCM